MNFKKVISILSAFLFFGTSTLQASENVCYNDYDSIAPYYDKMFGDRKHDIEFISEFLKTNNTDINSILELACGTGRVLKFFEDKIEIIYGLDISDSMLNIAKEKIKKGTFIHQTMENFSLQRKFDCILGTFGAINHLLEFKSWINVFESVAKSLENDGIFIFDMLSVTKLKELQSYSFRELECGDFKATISPNEIKEDEQCIYSDILKIIDKQGKLESECLRCKEMSFDIKVVADELKKYFQEIIIYEDVAPNEKTKKEIKVIEPSDDYTSLNCRVYFVCKKPKISNK